MGLHTILGAGGAISRELVPILLDQGCQVRLVSRTARPVNGAETVAADLIDSASVKKAVSGSSAVYLLAGLPYDVRIWRVQWPTIMTNVIAACKECGAKLVFFDNVYAYGLVQGTMTEDTPYRPNSQKGLVRANIADQLQQEMATGSIQALIARSADFYGPTADRSGIPNLLVFANLAKYKKAQWPSCADVPHSLTYVPDAARALAALASSDTAYGQVWHLPTARTPLTGRQFVGQAAASMSKPEGLTVLPTWTFALVGIFSRAMREMVEMSYQFDHPYLFDSTKFEKAFGSAATSYDDGIRLTGESYLDRA